MRPLRFRRIGFPLLFCIAAVSLLGCDSQSSLDTDRSDPRDTTDTSDDGFFRIVPIPDTTFWVLSDDRLIIYPEEHVTAADSADLEFEFTIVQGSSITPLATSGWLHASLSSVGQTLIRLNAVHPGSGLTAELEFLVNVVDEWPEDGCLLNASATDPDNFLPVAVGDSMGYTYEKTYYDGWTRVIHSGRLRLEAVWSECVDGDRIVTLKERLRYDETVVTYQATTQDTTVTSHDDERLVEWIEFGDGTTKHPFASEVLPRYHESVSDTVEVDGGQVRLPTISSSGMTRYDLHLVRGQGVVTTSFSVDLSSVAVYHSGQLLLEK